MNYRSWSVTDIKQLKDMVKEDVDIEEIQEVLDRSKISVVNQIKKLHKISPEGLVPVKEIEDATPRQRRTHIEKAAIDFMDIRFKARDYTNVWSSILGFQDALEEKSIEQYEASIQIKTNKWIGIAFAGDLHIGNMATDYKTMLEHRDLIAATPNLYVALNGDYCDNYLPSSHTAGMFEALFPPAVQKNLAKDYITTIRDKVLALVAGCFMKGSRVTMGNGSYKNIEDIREGDLVLSSDGKPHKVLKAWSSEHKDQVFKIYSRGNHVPLHVTNDHPCLVLKKEKYLSDDKWHIDKTTFIKDNLEIVKASSVRIGDYLASPIPQTNKDNKNPDFTIPLARLAGYWLAEGHYKKYNDKLSAIEFTFGINEKKYHEEVLEIATILGLNSSLTYRNDRNTATIRIKSEALAHRFYSLFGEYSKNKYIHTDILALPPETLIHLFDAFANGDGCFRLNYQGNKDLTVTTISSTLMEGLTFILDKCGITYSLRQQERTNRDNNDYQINLCEESIGYLRNMVENPELIDYTQFRGKSKRTQKVYDQMMWHKVKKIEAESFEGTVYDVSVQGLHDLIVNKRLIHNCHELWSLRASDFDLTEYLTKHSKAVYLGTGGILWLTVGKQKYKIMMRHKYRFNSQDNPTATVKKMFEKCGGFDLGVISHHHTATLEEGNKEGLDGNLKRIFLRAGSYKVHDRYAKQEGFGQGSIGVPIVLLNPKTRDLRGFQDIKEGIEYLSYLNNGK